MDIFRKGKLSKFKTHYVINVSFQIIYDRFLFSNENVLYNSEV